MLMPSEKLLPILDKLIGLPPVELTSPQAFTGIVAALQLCRVRIAADSSWASHTEELTRKATDAAHAIVHRLHAGEIGQEAAHTALGAIIDSTSGLIDRAALDALNEAYRSLRA